MDGLECSEITKSLIKNTTTFRLDSDYYKKEYLNIEKIILENNDKFTTIDSLGLTVNASAFYPSLEPYYNKGTTPFIRVADVKREINYDGCVRIPEMSNEFKTLYLCKKGDIVLTKGGSIGNVGLITQDSYVTRDLIFINSSILDRKDYLMLYLFFSTDFMYKQMIRSSSYSVQSHLTITLIRELLTYKYSDNLKSIAMKTYDLSEKMMCQSKAHYIEAEQLLLSALGLKDFTPSIEAVSVKLLSESFVSSGRLDSEYYQPKYDMLFEKIRNFECKPLGKIAIIKKSIEPGSDSYGNEGIPFVRVSDVTKHGISDPEIKLPCDVVSNVTSLYPKKDTILLSKDGSVGIAYKIEKDLEVITSSALLHLDIFNKKDVLPDYLTLVLNSLVVQLQAEREVSGAIIQHWKPSEIENVVIPILDETIQNEIAEKVQESFALKRKSQQLLEMAKCAVEIAIEEGEDKAIAWLNEVNI